ncbi:SRPBCC domain-containing protein [Pseudalkalibacillus sp. A8]|uniref:SRPBCC domain-containing protein n=1 Tax=Pseudalkalibacillus sp. A8 TaxID=3382641 RepID=UPI0038B5B0D7
MSFLAFFKAPRELVFNTYTDPTTVPDWWGPKRYTTIVKKMDMKKGGIWRFVHRDVEGNEYAFKWRSS